MILEIVKKYKQKMSKKELKDRIESAYTLEKKEFEDLLSELSDFYYNAKLDDQKEPITDEEYDSLTELYKNKFGKSYKKVGHNPPDKKKEKLPKYLGSLDKVRTDQEIDRWKKKYRGPYVITEKIDGVSALYDGKKLWTRGDGNIGTNISHVIEYLQLPRLLKGFVRGEIYMPKKIFNDKYKSEFSNTRNMVTGLLNPLSKNPNIDAIKDLVFLTYEYDDKTYSMSQSFQLDFLKKLNFKVPYFEIVNDVKILKSEYLSSLLKDRKTKADYDMDGLVVVNDEPEVQKINENPDNAIAFKIEGEFVNTEVEFVEWNVSKHGVLKPRVKVKKVNLCGVEINWATGFNAKFINDNKVSKGTIVSITRSGDVIPYIKEVIKGSELPDMPLEEYEWNETGVDIVLIEENNDVKKRKIIEFFRTLDAKFIGESTIDKVFSKGFDSLKKLFNLRVEDLLKIEGIKEKSAERIVNAIRSSISKVSLEKIATASGCFGLGFGEKKLKSILNVYPDILKRDVKKEDIEKIKGFKKMSKQFVENLPKFKKFLHDHPEVDIKEPELDIVFDDEEDSLLKDKKIVFTGVRDKEVEKKIEMMGGKVVTSVSKNTSILVTSQRYSGSSKEVKAEQLGLEILILKDFIEKYIRE